MEPLADPKNDRVIKKLIAPPHKPLISEFLYSASNKINIKMLKQHLKKEGRIAKIDFLKIIRLAGQILKNQPNVIYIYDPITIVGDIHGQFYDLLKLLQVGGDPQLTKYLFLGDYIDRGYFSIEVILLLFSLKINFPDTITLLRGNHQCRHLSSYFNFRTQCLYKFDQQVYQKLIDVFNLLPLSCILNNKFICVHGGISPQVKTIQDIFKIDRFKQIPKSGLLCDLVWSDPIFNQQENPSQKTRQNQIRGCSYFFGYDSLKGFLQKNKLISVIRGHQAQMQGYKMHKWRGKNNFPTVITLFSAPNYCGIYHNKGAIIKFLNNKFNIHQYYYQEGQPYMLPNFMNVFSWSFPFVAQKVGQILQNILRPNDQLKQEELIDLQKSDQLRIFLEVLQNQKQKKQKNSKLLQLNGLCVDSKLIDEKLIQQVKQHKKIGDFTSKDYFEKTRIFDLKNQKRPPI